MINTCQENRNWGIGLGRVVVLENGYILCCDNTQAGDMKSGGSKYLHKY